MFTLKNEIEFDMAHYLTGYDGKCANIHGHRYRLIVSVSSEELHEDGHLRSMVDDFSNIKQVLKRVADWFDHKLLIEDNDEGRTIAESFREQGLGFEIVFVDYRTTAEEMTRDIFRRIRAEGVNVTEVELFETPTNSCVYSEV